MRHHTICASAIAALFLTLGAPAAVADEAFLCDGGRIVYVKFGELERMKATDACVASHFGLAVAAPSPASAAVPAASRPVTKPTTPGLSLTTLSEVATARKPVRQQTAAAPRATVAHPATDFRNVTVINAAAPGETIFHHAR